MNIPAPRILDVLLNVTSPLGKVCKWEEMGKWITCGRNEEEHQKEDLQTRKWAEGAAIVHKNEKVV